VRLLCREGSPESLTGLAELRALWSTDGQLLLNRAIGLQTATMATGVCLHRLRRPGALKVSSHFVDISGDMTTNTAFREDWTSHPVGKTLRWMIAAAGVIFATLVVMLALMGGNPAWFVVLLGCALGAVSVRAAREPSMVRLTSVFAALVAVALASILI